MNTNIDDHLNTPQIGVKAKTQSFHNITYTIRLNHHKLVDVLCTPLILLTHPIFQGLSAEPGENQLQSNDPYNQCCLVLDNGVTGLSIIHDLLYIPHVTL